MGKQSAKSAKSKILTVLFIILAAVFVFSTYQLIEYKITGDREQAVFDNLAEELAAYPVQESNPQERFQALYAQNNDFFGWLQIEGTVIDYPVMYTPNDSQYYLHRSFDKKKSSSGTLFMDAECPPDGNYYLIYGHHMRNGSMFGALPKYAKKAYWEEHPVITFDTPSEHREYRIMSAFFSKIYSKKKTGVFKYYEYADLTDPAVFSEYVQQALAASLYNTGVTAEYGDDLMALSTCNYHTDNGRFVVVAKRVL